MSELTDAIEEMTDAIAEQSKAIFTLEKKVDRQNERLAEFVPKSRFRAAVASLLISGLLVFGFAVWAREERQREFAKERTNLIAGCERNNDQRRTLAEVISRAVRPSSVPPTATDPELLALIEEGRQRTIALRSELLALPGVQIVDCEAAFPK